MEVLRLQTMLEILHISLTIMALRKYHLHQYYIGDCSPGYRQHHLTAPYMKRYSGSNADKFRNAVISCCDVDVFQTIHY